MAMSVSPPCFPRSTRLGYNHHEPRFLDCRGLCLKTAQVGLIARAEVPSFVFNRLKLSNDIPGMVSYLDKDSQRRIDDLGATDPGQRPTMSLRSHDELQAI
jgi:hypothetical protein